jgi:hypothetical protein
MKRIAFLLFAAITMACFVVSFSPASGHAAGEAAPIYVTQIPPGYRDWKVIAVAHEEGNLNSLGAILGNDTAIKAYRDRKLPFPDGSYRRFALSSCPVGGKQQSFRARAIVRSRDTHEHTVYGQGLNKVRGNGRLGIRSLQRKRRETWR